MEKVTNGQAFIDGEIEKMEDVIEEKQKEMVQTLIDKGQQLLDEATKKAKAKQDELADDYYVDTEGREALAKVNAQVEAEVQVAKDLVESELKDEVEQLKKYMLVPIEDL